MRARWISVLAVLVAACSGSSSTTEPAVEVKPVFSLREAPVIVRSGAPSQSASSVLATFNLVVEAVGGDVSMSMSYADLPLVDFGIYANGARANLSVNAETNYPIPDGVPAVPLGSMTFTVKSGRSVVIPISFSFDSRTKSGTLIPVGSYSVGVEAIRWSAGSKQKSETSMAGSATWRTPQVVLP